MSSTNGEKGEEKDRNNGKWDKIKLKGRGAKEIERDIIGLPLPIIISPPFTLYEFRWKMVRYVMFWYTMFWYSMFWNLMFWNVMLSSNVDDHFNYDCKFGSVIFICIFSMFYDNCRVAFYDCLNNGKKSQVW